MKMSQNRRAVNLINRLRELNLTRKDFATAAGVSERAVYHWFSYEREPKLTFKQVAGVCSLLQWTAEQLADAYYSDPSENVTAEADDYPK